MTPILYKATLSIINNHLLVNKAAFFILFFLFILHTHPASAQQKDRGISTNSYSSAKLTYRLIPGTNNTWGYDIYANNKLLIHQPSRPALPGNEAETKHKSQVVAKMVIEKIRKGNMPPSISIAELQKAKVI